MTCDGVDMCLATEECNYCDDDDDGTFHDETALAEVTDSVVLDCDSGIGDPDSVRLVSATCETGAGYLRNAHVLDTLTRADSGAMHTTVPMGFGKMSVFVRARFEKSTTTGSNGGWAVVFIAEGSLSLTSSGAGYDRSAVGRGIAVEWSFNGNFTDTLSLVRLDGTASGEEVSALFTGVDIGELNPSYDAQSGSAVLQTLFIEYTPELGTTPGDENAVRVSHFDPESSGIGVDNVRMTPNAAMLMEELAAGDDATVVAVAGETTSRSDGWFNIGYDHPLRRMSYIDGLDLCAAHPDP